MSNQNDIEEDIQIVFELIQYLNSNCLYDFVEYAYINYSVIYNYQIFIDKLNRLFGNNSFIYKQDHFCVIFKLENVFVKITPIINDFPIQTMKIHCLEEII